MTKYKDLKVEEKEFVDFVQLKWIRVIGFSAFLGLGIWMLLSPEKPEHQYIEKVTVSLMKDLWGTTFGIIMVSIGLIGLAYFLSIILKFRNGYAWIRLQKGYYMFLDQRRVSGLNSIYNGNDLLVFHPEKSKVLEFKNYTNSPIHKYKKAAISKEFNNDEIYWSADKDGYVIIYKGQGLNNTTSEWRGDDLIVKSTEKFVTIHLKNYRNLKDGKVRTASRV